MLNVCKISPQFRQSLKVDFNASARSCHFNLSRGKKKVALYVSKKVYNECSVAEFGAGTDENKLIFDEW